MTLEDEVKKVILDYHQDHGRAPYARYISNKLGVSLSVIHDARSNLKKAGFLKQEKKSGPFFICKSFMSEQENIRLKAIVNNAFNRVRHAA